MNRTMTMATSSSRNSLSPSLPPLHHPPFTPIQECEREGREDEELQERTPNRGTENTREIDTKHHPTPLHKSDGRAKAPTRKRPESEDGTEDNQGISCNKCRPSNREKISVVPLDNNNNGVNKSSIASPNGIFKSIFALMKKSPRSLDSSSAPSREEQWKIAVAELSHKLIHATRKREEAQLEASRLKYSMAELEKKLSKLEIYCHSLKSGLEVCTNNSPKPTKHQHMKIGDDERVIESFLIAVSESRSSVRVLSRSLALLVRQMGNKVYERISLLLQPYDIRFSLSKNPRSLLCYLEALLNRAFFEDFESVGFQKSSPTRILNPIQRCEANFASFEQLHGLTWEEVLNKGTRHFSEEYSRFCDRKMSEIVAMLGWNRAWPEPLLQAFFGASKSVWLVHLLANSVHPSLPIFRTDKEAKFDPIYMEDMGGDKTQKLIPGTVRIMITPGFYIYGSVVKCKVLCRYQNNTSVDKNNGEMGLTPIT